LERFRLDVDAGSPYSIPASNPFFSDLPFERNLPMAGTSAIVFDQQTGDMALIRAAEA
jgi:hypothetical protein